MEKNKIENQIKEMELPEVQMPDFQQRLKMTLLNTRKSAFWGIILLVMPTLFAFINILKYSMGLSSLWNPFDKLFQFRLFDILSPVIFLGGIFLAILLNLLSIIHISFQKAQSEYVLIVTMKKKWLNIMIIVFAFLILSIFGIYLTIENLI